MSESFNIPGFSKEEIAEMARKAVHEVRKMRININTDRSNTEKNDKENNINSHVNHSSNDDINLP